MAKKKDDEPKDMKADPKAVKPKEVTETIDVSLSPAELLEIGKKHAEALNEIDLMKPTHDTIKKNLKLEASNADARERKLRTIIETGKEPRQIVCIVDFDWKTGKATIKRKDSGEFVRERDVHESERQLNIGTMRAAMEAKGLLANAPDGKPIVGTAQGKDFFEKVGAAVIEINRNAKDVEPGENVTVPPDALDDENDEAT